jgi:CheY-like chemotaxis protein
LIGSVDEGEVVIEVNDNGVGIPTDLLPYVFDLFTQGERGPDRSQGGLGIGLALVKKLVEMHGGRVEVKSVPASGSTFTLRLPLAEALVSSATEPARSLSVARRLLLVDDNVDAIQSLQMLLELSGHTVRCAHDSEAALAMMEEFLPDVCVLDIGLPGMDGYQLARRLRAMSKLRNTRFIAISGYAPDSTRSGALFDYYLSKPVNHQALYAALDGVPGA